MTENEQVQEMAKIAAKSDDTCRAATIAKGIYNSGYRKASEVAREIFAEIEEQIAVFKKYMYANENVKAIVGGLEELKKRYTEEQDDDGE